ncbi:MAG: hypothetical protein ACI8PZ_006839 [Myxococcota bacterium]|jgi:hypothetical protein
MLTALALLAAPAAAQTLTMTGVCPGRVAIDIEGITPGGDAAFLAGMAGRGADAIGIGVCTGVDTGLHGIRYITRVSDADGDGRIRLEPSFPDGRCEVPIQVVDVASCELTNVATPVEDVGCARRETCALTGPTDPSTVFNTGEVTYYFQNNLMGMLWHAESDAILGGHYSSDGYYHFPAFTGDYPALPTNDAGVSYGRMVLAAGTGVVVRNNDTYNPVALSAHSVGMIDPVTGHPGDFVPAVPSDGFGGSCNLISASASQFLCFDGGTVRHYDTTPDSGVLTLDRVVTLTGALPTDLCAANCYGGRFAWDGEHYYLPDDGNGSTNIRYQVYDAGGANVGTYDVTGSDGINSLYFDWSVCRYTSHDGWGDRGLGDLYTYLGGSFSDDSQVYGFPAESHTPVGACD